MIFTRKCNFDGVRFRIRMGKIRLIQLFCLIRKYRACGVFLDIRCGICFGFVSQIGVNRFPVLLTDGGALAYTGILILTAQRVFFRDAVFALFQVVKGSCQGKRTVLTRLCRIVKPHRAVLGFRRAAVYDPLKLERNDRVAVGAPDVGLFELLGHRNVSAHHVHRVITAFGHIRLHRADGTRGSIIRSKGDLQHINIGSAGRRERLDIFNGVSVFVNPLIAEFSRFVFSVPVPFAFVKHLQFRVRHRVAEENRSFFIFYRKQDRNVDGRLGEF